jgi:cytochrome c553
MKRILCVSLTILLTQSAYAAPLPGDSAAGQRLVDANCMRCHNTSVYSREDHKVRSLDALKQQLDRCSHAADKSFSATEMQDIIKYLNDQFYHFQ